MISVRAIFKECPLLVKSWVLIILEWTLWSPGAMQTSTTEVCIPCLFWLCCEARGILAPWPGIKPVPPASEAQSPNHWTTKEVPLYFLNFYLGCMCGQSLSRVWLFATLWTVAQQPPLSMLFARQEYWSGLPCPLPGDLLSQESISCVAGRFFTSEPSAKPRVCIFRKQFIFSAWGVYSFACGSYSW